jgi:hypothetical protein
MVGACSRTYGWRDIFEAALGRNLKPVEATPYDGGSQNSLFTNSTQYDDELRRMTAFLLRHLQIYLHHAFLPQERGAPLVFSERDLTAFWENRRVPP